MLLLGYGYVARHVAPRLLTRGWTVRATMRVPAAPAQGVALFAYNAGGGLTANMLAGVDHLLVSIPPDAQGDAAAADLRAALSAGPHTLGWIGYLSATSVYGDRDGAWVDETAEPRPSDGRGRRRLAAENQWQAVGRDLAIATHIFRLASIYGPGRNALQTVRAGLARRIDKPGHYFSRIHVEDIAATILASTAHPRAGAIYNLADDAPASSADVIAHACALLGQAAPAAIGYDQAVTSMSEMARSFYADNKRIANGLIKQELGVRLAYPDYRSGLAALLTQEKL